MPRAVDGVDDEVTFAAEGEVAELVGMGDAEFFEEHFVGGGEDGGVGSDGEGEGGDGDDGEAGRFSEDAGGVAEVGEEFVPPAEAEGVAHAVFVGVEGAEFQACLAAGLFGGEAGVDEVGGAGVEVEGDFVVHVGFEARAAGDGAEPGGEAGEGVHERASEPARLAAVRSRMVPMMPAMRFHFSISSASCFLPTAVRE